MLAHIFSFPLRAYGVVADRTAAHALLFHKTIGFGPLRVRTCSRPCEWLASEPGALDRFQVFGVVSKRGCRRYGSRDSFCIPTPHSAIRHARRHDPDLAGNI